MKHIQQYRPAFNSENTYYEVSHDIIGAIQCKQGEYIGKWFITLAELESRNDIAPNLEDELYLVTHINPAMFEEAQAPQPQPFNLRDWELSEVEPAVKLHIENIIRELPYDYISIHEPNTWVDDDTYGYEAQAIRAWIRSCWISMRQQIDGLDSAIDIQQIILNLPTLNV